MGERGRGWEVRKGLTELLAVLGVDGAAVDDADSRRDLRRDDLRDELARRIVHLLRLSGSGDLAGTNCPDGLVRDDDLPVMRRKTAIRDL